MKLYLGYFAATWSTMFSSDHDYKNTQLSRWTLVDFSHLTSTSSISTVISKQQEHSRRCRLWPRYSPCSTPLEAPFGSSSPHHALNDSPKYGLAICLSKAKFTCVVAVWLVMLCYSVTQKTNLIYFAVKRGSWWRWLIVRWFLFIAPICQPGSICGCFGPLCQFYQKGWKSWQRSQKRQ